MSALRLDVEIEQGATFQREFTATADGLAFDMSGFTVTGAVYDSAGTAAAAFATSISTNKILIELTDEQTASLPDSTSFTHTYSVFAVSPAGIGYKIAKGNVLIS